MILVFSSCRHNTLENNHDVHKHINDTITLSSYGIKLGDSLSVVQDKFPNLYQIPLEQLEEHLPLKNEIGEIYDLLEASIYRADTTFIVDHSLNKSGYTRNGSPIDFPGRYSSHRTIIVFFVLNNKIFQIELFINTPHELEHDYFPNEQWGYTADEMFQDKYEMADSIIIANNKERRAVTIDINASEKERKDAEDFVGYKYSKAKLWCWKNAQLITQVNYNDFGIKGNYFNFYNVFRVIYTDVKAINDEIERQKQQEEQMEKEKQQEIENKQKCLHNRIIKQDL